MKDLHTPVVWSAAGAAVAIAVAVDTVGFRVVGIELWGRTACQQHCIQSLDLNCWGSDAYTAAAIAGGSEV